MYKYIMGNVSNLCTLILMDSVDVFQKITTMSKWITIKGYKFIPRELIIEMYSSSRRIWNIVNS